MYNYN